LLHFIKTVNTTEDLANIHIALDKYLDSKKVKNGYIKNGSTWFNQWADFINYTDPKTEKDKEDDYRKLIYRDEK